MKICLLTRNFDLSGGIGRVSSGVRDELIRRGHKVYCLSTRGEGLASYFMYTSLGIPLRLPRDADVYHALTPMESIWIPKERSISVILDLIALTHPSLYGGRWSKSLVTFHDLAPITNTKLHGAGFGGNTIKSLIARRYFEFACKEAVKCKYIVTVSEHVREEVIRIFKVPNYKVITIESGIRDDLEPQPKKDYMFRVGYLAQLDRRKRVNLLIEAAKKGEIDELVIGGKGLDEVYLRELAGAYLGYKIKFMGFIPDDKIVEFYNSLDVFVFPTAIEGFGLPIIEAMACKKPVVVLHDAIIPWEVKKRCIITEDLGPLFWNRKYLENLCKGVDIEGNYKWAKEHTWKSCVDKYIELYKEVSGV